MIDSKGFTKYLHEGFTKVVDLLDILQINLHAQKLCTCKMKYLIPIKIRAPLNFAPLISAPLIFEHPQISPPLIFAHPYFTVNLLFFHSFVVFFLLPLIFAYSHCANLLPLIFAQARCAKIKGARILMGIR